MREALLLAAICGLTYLGFGVLALSQDRHWIASTGRKPDVGMKRLQRVLAGLLLTASLGLSLARDGTALGLILWATVITAGALAITFTLCWRPQWLRPLAWPRAPAAAKRARAVKG